MRQTHQEQHRPFTDGKLFHVCLYVFDNLHKRFLHILAQLDVPFLKSHTHYRKVTMKVNCMVIDRCKRCFLAHGILNSTP